MDEEPEVRETETRRGRGQGVRLQVSAVAELLHHSLGMSKAELVVAKERS